MKKFILNRSQVFSNPTLQFAKNMIEKVRGYDEIVSIGGGSTIDVGKYVAFHLKIPHTAIPTTAGTGSEVTKFAVFDDKEKRVSLEDDGLIPENYILDPSRIVTLPLLQTASTGLDALSQAIESYWSPEATDESKKYSYEAIKRVMGSLWASCRYLESELFRKAMLEAANYSGKAINITRTSICHAISYPLTFHYGVPHGLACVYTLPFFMRYFNFKLVKDWEVESLMEEIGAKIHPNIDRDLVIKETLESSRSQNTPKPVTKEVIYECLSSNNL